MFFTVKKHRTIFLIAMILIGIGFLVYSAKREPRYKGKSLREWIILSRGIDSGEPAFAIRQMGTKSLPFLIKMLSAEDGATEKQIQRWAKSFIRINLHAAAWENECAIAGFKILGPIARPAIPALVQILNSTNINAGPALGWIGPESIPALTNALNSSEPIIYMSAIGGLAHVRPTTPAILQLVKNSISNSNPEIKSFGSAAWNYATNQPGVSTLLGK